MNAAAVSVWTFCVACGIAVVSPASPARAQSAQDIRAALPGLPVAAGHGGELLLGGEFRQSSFRQTRSGFELSLHWNGVDDDKWPFERIVSALASHRCGDVSERTVAGHMERLYKSKSLVPERSLGGNAGDTFKRRISVRLGTCQATFNAEGARWHTLSVSVTQS